MFAAILKDQHGPVTMATLQELALVTAVVSNSGVGRCTELQVKFVVVLTDCLMFVCVRW